MTSVALPAKVNPNVDATFEDALFMVVVRSKDSEDASDTLPTFQAVMPADSVVACDARGGLAARRPSSVQLLTRDRVSIALYSSTLDAAAVVDGFVSRRDAHRDDPRARANALRVFLRDLKNQGHCFTLAAFDESRRALAAWTPRSAPMSFGHARDGAVVLVASAPRARSLVGEHLAGDDDVTLAHLPAGRFVYGHGYLRPFEFTELWSSARGNRAGTVARAQNVDPNLDKPKLSPEDGKKWRWEKTGSRAEQADRWTKKVTKETVAAATKSTSPALSAASAPFVAAKQKASSIVEKPTTLRWSSTYSLTQNIFGMGDQYMPSTTRNRKRTPSAMATVLVQRLRDRMLAADSWFTTISADLFSGRAILPVLATRALRCRAGSQYSCETGR